MRSSILCALLAATIAAANEAYPPERFTDPQRTEKLRSAFPEIDTLFRNYAKTQRITGMVWGIVLDGRVDHIAAVGVQDRGTGAPVSAASVFRIASMTKSFTALAVLKLRDEGKLSLEDPVSRWIPEIGRMELPTRDSAPLRVRQLLSHSGGLPEDNPWGDQQLGASEDALTAWLRAGIPFSTAPGTRFEYSNYAFGLLGRIVAKASGQPYEKYVRTEILAKLNMNDTTFDFASVPAAKRVTGYRIEPDGNYREEPPLPHGVFGAMGGLLTNANDLVRFVAFHLSAWPPRDDAEAGPVRRSSVREMAQLWTPANLSGRGAGAEFTVSQSGYGYGLAVRGDCRFAHIVGHGGGLPGFGSYMAWLPEYGVGIFGMANLTYSGPSGTINLALDALRKTGGLQKRETPASGPLVMMRERIWKLWNRWDDKEANKMAAVNLFLDAPAAQRRAEIQRVKDEVGRCTAAGPVRPENWLRGQFNLTCEQGTAGIYFTLAPTQPPTLQHVKFRKLAQENERMFAPTGGPPPGVNCRQ